MAQLNLIPYDIREKKRKNHQLRQQIAAGIILVCVLFFGVYFPMGTLSSLKSHEASLQQQIDLHQDIILENKEIKSQTDQFNRYIQKALQLSTDKTRIVNRIRGIETYTPDAVKFGSLNYSDTGLLITGTSADYNAICEMGANLQMSKEYQEAKIASINYDLTNRLYSFTIMINEGGPSV